MAYLRTEQLRHFGYDASVGGVRSILLGRDHSTRKGIQLPGCFVLPTPFKDGRYLFQFFGRHIGHSSPGQALLCKLDKFGVKQ
jgi:hypothetical protein